MPPPPRVFRVCCDFWEAPWRLQNVWWAALSAACGSQACEWRHLLLLYQGAGSLIAPKHLLHDICAPRQVVGILEHLVEEGRLERRTATRIEEFILHYVNKQGGWYGGQQGAGTT